MYPRPHLICVAGFVCQSAPADAIFEPGSACGMPYAPELGFSASYIQPLSLFHRSRRQVHWVFWLKPNTGSMLYPMLCAVPGSGGCAAAVVTLVELDEEFAAALCEATTC